jgi:hypothetical protein
VRGQWEPASERLRWSDATLRRSPPYQLSTRRWASFVGPLRVKSWRADDSAGPTVRARYRAQSQKTNLRLRRHPLNFNPGGWSHVGCSKSCSGSGQGGGDVEDELEGVEHAGGAEAGDLPSPGSRRFIRSTWRALQVSQEPGGPLLCIMAQAPGNHARPALRPSSGPKERRSGPSAVRGAEHAAVSALAPLELRGSGLLAAVQSFGNLAASASPGRIWTARLTALVPWLSCSVPLSGSDRQESLTPAVTQR